MNVVLKSTTWQHVKRGVFKYKCVVKVHSATTTSMRNMRGASWSVVNTEHTFSKAEAHSFCCRRRLRLYLFSTLSDFFQETEEVVHTLAVVVYGSISLYVSKSSIQHGVH